MLFSVGTIAPGCYGRDLILYDYERKDSPFVRIAYGENYADRQVIKTSIRKDDPQRARKVRAELHRLEAQLLRAGPAGNGRTIDGWRWVAPYLKARYANRTRTLQVYLAQWRSLRDFLDEHEVDSPAALDREIVFEYSGWRTAQVKQKSKRHPKINTAIGELKLLGLILDEAVTRHLILQNPARSLGIERELAELRPELTDDWIRTIRNGLVAIKDDPHKDWMGKSFEMALRTGMRRNETCLHRSQVRIASDDIVLEKPKGGRKREFAIPIYSSIREMIDEFMESGREYFWTLPAGTLPGLVWSKFLGQLGLRKFGVVFHCTRVTFISRGCRDGIPEAVMQKMVNHADKEISRIYQRWTSDDVRRYAERAGRATNLS